MGQQAKAPEVVRVHYSREQGSHIFSSPELPNLLVGHPNLEQAFKMVPGMVSRLVERIYHRVDVYEADMSYLDFQRQMEGAKCAPENQPVIVVRATHASQHTSA